MEPTYNENYNCGYEEQEDFGDWGMEDEDFQAPGMLQREVSTGPAFVRGTSFSLIEEDDIGKQQTRMIAKL